MSNAYYEEPPENYPIGRQFQRRQLDVLRTTTDRLPHTWITIEGEIIEMAKMNNSHLRNTVQMLRRTSLRKLARRRDVLEVGEAEQILNQHLGDVDQRATAAWGEVYDELLQEALYRSEDGDLETWLNL